MQLDVFGVRLINLKKGKVDFKKGNCDENSRCVNEFNNLSNGFGQKGGCPKKVIWVRLKNQ